MLIRKLIVCSMFLFTVTGCAENTLKFERLKIGNVNYEAASAFDVDNDGHKDIISGEYWFSGPDFKKQYKICDVNLKSEYYDDFVDYPMDVDGDGYTDIITGGWWGMTVRWRQNPQDRDTMWKIHDIDQCGRIETVCFWDLDGDKYVEVVPPAYGNFVAYKLERDNIGKGTGKFTKRIILENFRDGHGLGFGDIDGDGRGDFVTTKGWIEAPKDPNGEWTLHDEFLLDLASMPILVYDINGDGLADFIYGAAHSYGLFWMEQKRDVVGKRYWFRHDIDTTGSQYHTMVLSDIDNDGEPELITGKRHRAHNGNDPGENDPLGLYYFKIKNGEFKKFIIDYGPAEKTSGFGVYSWVEDIDGNGFKDIIASGKQGLYLFKNLGPSK